MNPIQAITVANALLTALGIVICGLFILALALGLYTKNEDGEDDHV